MDLELIYKKNLLNNVKNIIDTRISLVSNLSNISRLFQESFSNTLWCGFYIFDDRKTLYLGFFSRTFSMYYYTFR